MRSEDSSNLFQHLQGIVMSLYSITITDPWERNEGGNIQDPTIETQKHTMAAVLAGIKTTEGQAPSILGRGHIVQSPEDWLAQGRKTLTIRKGVCTDCAAAAVVCVMQQTRHSCDRPKRLEIISNTRHAFVVINRAPCRITSTEQWGDDAFVIDIWRQNQFRRGEWDGIYWVNNSYYHPGAQFIRNSQSALRVETTFIDSPTL